MRLCRVIAIILYISLFKGLPLLCQPQTRIELPQNLFVFTFQEDREKKLWLGLSDGNQSGDLALFDGEKLSLASERHSIPAGSYHVSLRLSDGSLMFGGNIVNSKGFPLLVWVSPMGIDTLQIPFTVNNPLVNCITLANRFEIWIGTASGLFINRRGQWEWLTIRNGLPDNFITSIHQDFRGIVWIGTENGMAFFYDGVINSPQPNTRIINSITSIFSDSRGYLWCGARFASEGISVYNGEVWDTFSGRHGLIDNSASIFFQDNQGNLWIGSCYNRSRGGVSMFDGKSWKSFNFPEYLAKPCVDAIATDAQGRIWMAGSLTPRKGKGITVFDGISWKHLAESEGFPAERVLTFYLDHSGYLWVSSFEGLFRINTESLFLK